MLKSKQMKEETPPIRLNKGKMSWALNAAILKYKDKYKEINDKIISKEDVIVGLLDDIRTLQILEARTIDLK